MKIDVLFIHPGNQQRTYQALAREHTALATPMWTCLLAETTRRNGFATAIYDANVEGWDAQVPSELLARHNPELIVIMVYGHAPSASTWTMPSAQMAARDIKAFNASIPIAMGGIHPSSLPERTLREEAIDYVIQGEGVHTINGLLRAMKGHGDIAGVPGLWHVRQGQITANTPAPIVKDLDAELPDYAWDLLPPLTQYRAHNMHCFQDFEKSQKEDFSDIRKPYVAMNTSLGCPFNCSYCCINAIFGKPGIRYWSLDRVMSWLETLRHQGVRNIRFDDELFILSPKRVEDFCDRVIERKLDLNLFVYGRVDTMQPPMLGKMKQAGINWISLGIEAANEAVRNEANKRIRGDIGDVVRTIQAHDIYVLGNYMFGLPEDTLQTMEETLQLADDLNCEFPNIYTVMPLPGSKLYEKAVASGCLPPSWNAFSQFSVDTQPMPTRHVSAVEVLRFRDAATLRHMSSERYLGMVGRRFGPRARRHIETMLTVKLERRLLTNPDPAVATRLLGE